MFEEIDALPGAEGELPAIDGDAEVDAGEDGANVGGHVVRPLKGVTELARVFGNEAFEKVFDVGDHIRVVVLLDGERSGGVAAEESEQCGCARVIGDPVRDLRCNVVESFAPGRDR